MRDFSLDSRISYFSSRLSLLALSTAPSGGLNGYPLRRNFSGMEPSSISSRVTMFPSSYLRRLSILCSFSSDWTKSSSAASSSLDSVLAEWAASLKWSLRSTVTQLVTLEYLTVRAGLCPLLAWGSLRMW